MKDLTRSRLSSEVRIAINTPNNLLSAANTLGRSADFKEFKAAARFVRSDHWNVIDDTAYGQRESSKKFWRLLKQQSDQSGIPPLRVSEDEYAVNPSKKAEMLNDYFANVYSDDGTTVTTPTAAVHPTEITTETVVKAMFRIPHKSSSGGFLVTNRITKAGGRRIAAVLAKFFRIFVSRGNIPADWKM